MKTTVRTAIIVATTIITLALASASFAQTLEERRAAVWQRAEEGLRYISNALAQAQAEAEARRAVFVLRPPLDPEAAIAAAEKQRYVRKRELAPWLFGADGLPTAEGVKFFENKAGVTAR